MVVPAARGFEHPAAIATALAERGVALRVVRLDLDEPLPDVDEVAGLVVMGGPMGAFDDAAHSFLAGERALLGACVERAVPVLGVCLGAQLLAGALGAAVRRGPHSEVGAGTVRLSPEAAADPVLGGAPDPLPVLHWHHDTFDLPAGAVLLASSDRYPHQAFRVGRRAYGLQFHVELGPEQHSLLREHLGPTRAPSPAELVEIGAAGGDVLRRWAAASAP